MPYKSQADQRRHDKEYQRKRRETEAPPAAFPEELKSTRPIRTVADVLARVDTYLQLLESGDMPVATRCRTAKELLSVSIKALEVADLGGRIKRIEEHLKLRGLSLPVVAPAPEQGESETEIIQ